MSGVSAHAETPQLFGPGASWLRPLKKKSPTPKTPPAVAPAQPVAPPPRPALGWASGWLRAFCAVDGDATFVWTRWLILRAVGLLFIVMFSGIIAESRALLSPEGITPIAETLASVRQQFPNPITAFLNAPGLFWLGAGWPMIATLQWLGMLAAVALTLNLWPRGMMFTCWLVFLSFVSSSPFFAQTQPDSLMLEVALLCIPFAPAGLWPGLAKKAAPRPLMVFILRLMLLRLMVQAGLAKFVYGEAMWRDFTAMDVMYETAPFPTVLGHLLHPWPHWFHVLEIGVTFAAEAIAPVIMVCCGRRGRWWAFAIWAFFQLGIQFTNNFAWLNVGAIGLALILLDDQMLTGAAERLRLTRLAAAMRARLAGLAPARPRPWALHGLRWAFGLHCVAALCFYAVSPVRIRPEQVPAVIAEPMKAVGHFYGANSFALFGNLPLVRYEVEFQGSNDGGETWRSYEFRYKIQRADRMAPFVAPWYPRFDAILQHVRVAHTVPELYPATAERLLRRQADVMALFRRDPFPDRPPTMIRMVDYRYHYTDRATWLATGRYWNKTLVGDWQPMLYLTPQGEVTSGQ